MPCVKSETPAIFNLALNAGELIRFSNVSELLLEFAEKAGSPLRFQKIPKQRKIKCL